MRTPRGFTLLETLLAVALAAALLIAVNFFVLSMGELWGGGSEARLFDRHVRGVTRFLESLVQQAVVPTTSATTPDGTAPQTTPQTRLAPPTGLARWAALILGDGIRQPATVGALAGPRVGFLLAALATRTQVGPPSPPQGEPPTPRREGGAARIPEQVRTSGTNRAGATGASRSGSETDSQEATGERFRIATPAGYEGAPPMLMFEVDEAPGQCVWPVRPLPQVECALQINADEGLVLLWKSKLEEDYGKGRPRKTQLSPFGQAVAFEYYDADRKSWTRAEQPQSDGNGGWLVPQRLRLTFVNGAMRQEVSIVLPGAPGGAPLR
jgi:prepilin-type N-terminal cleavage/methylation domain-containing protein